MSRFPENWICDSDQRSARYLNRRQKRWTKRQEQTLEHRQKYLENKCQMQELPSQESTD